MVYAMLTKCKSLTLPTARKTFYTYNLLNPINSNLVAGWLADCLSGPTRPPSSVAQTNILSTFQLFSLNECVSGKEDWNRLAIIVMGEPKEERSDQKDLAHKKTIIKTDTI